MPTKLVNVAPGIYQRRGARGVSWWIQYRVPFGRAGVRATRRTKVVQERLRHCATLDQARKALAVRLSELFRGQFVDVQEATTLGDFVPVFLESRGKMPIRRIYKQQLRDRFAIWFPRLLTEISRDDVLALYHRRCSQVSLSTARAEIACLRALFFEAQARGLVASNPCAKLRLKEPQNGRDRVLSFSEMNSLFTAARRRGADDFIRPLFFTLYFTGARLSEALSLSWSDVDLVEATVRFRDAKTRAPRVVPLNDIAVAELQRWKQRTTRHPVWLFPNPTGKAPLIKVSKSWRSLLREAGVSNLRRHDLRHNFVSQLQMAGVNDTTIADLTGHRTLAMLKRYSHSRDEARKGAVARMPREQSPSSHDADSRFKNWD